MFYTGAAALARMEPAAENGAVNINQRNSINGETPLHTACRGAHPAVVRLLVGWGAQLTLADYLHRRLPLDVVGVADPLDRFVIEL